MVVTMHDIETLMVCHSAPTPISSFKLYTKNKGNIEATTFMNDNCKSEFANDQVIPWAEMG